MAKADTVDGNPSFPAPPNHGPVEARSLSSITSIASNPPAYPRNPTQKKLDPLVLYIVRVPGSKDIFLSPLKPPTKSSVSAEAINASLYYLHVASPDDDILLQECEQEREELDRLRREGLIDDPDMPLPTPEFARLNNVRRKPVPGDKGKADLEFPPPLPTRPRPISSQLKLETGCRPQSADSIPPPVLPPRPNLAETSSPAEAMARLTGNGHEGFLDPPPAYEALTPPILPRPFPTTPKDGVFQGSRSPLNTSNRWSAAPTYGQSAVSGRHSLDAPRAQVRPRSAHDNSFYAPSGSPARSPGQSPSRRPYESTNSHQPGFHITLIRRDPAHGNQWNVATMSTTHLDGGGVDIHVSTPGYSRFIARQEPVSLESFSPNITPEARQLLAKSALKSSQLERVESPIPPHDPSQTRRFHRKLFVSRPSNPDEIRSSLDISGNRHSVDGYHPDKSHSSKLKRGYYTFTSPWNGTCTFSTSVNGRSLKCKHMIPTASGLPNNPDTNPAVTVAEIRFNTPFQAGQRHYQPGSSHVSPFALSQASAATTPDTTTPPFPPYNQASQPITTSSPIPPSSSSKRAALAQFFNSSHSPRFNRTRRPSTSSSSSGDHLDPTPTHNPNANRAPPLRRPPSDDRLDLSLAHERAGGGMRGKSAKLGKLIIEDEGIKMLDLVVAACMAVWWRGYYY